MEDDDLTLPGEASITVESNTTATETDDEKVERERIEKILKLARKRFRTVIDAESHFRTEAQDDIKFRAGTWGKQSFQWPAGVQQQREAEDRPCLTVNRAPGFIRQVTNQARKANLTVKVKAVDDRGDPKLAEVLQGLVRNVEVASMADRAYAMGSEKQAEIGKGFFRLLTEWATDKGDDAAVFQTRIKIKRETNPLSIYLDPAHEEADGSDADFAFKPTDVDRLAFKDLTGVEPPQEAALTAFEGEGDETGEWFPNGKIRIAEYFSREAVGERKHLAMLSDGAVIPYPTPAQQAELATLVPPTTIKMDRWIQRKVMVWRKITATQILEESVWGADAQPWIPVLGDELQVDGVKDWRGVVRDSKDSGRIYNVEVSALVEAVGLGQKAPVVGYRGQFGAPNSNTRKAWETANTKPHAFLEVEPLDLDGKPAPLPQRIVFDAPIQGIVVAIHQADEDYKSTAGFRDASMGERGPQESGRAIALRQDQDLLGSSHYLDNLRFAIAAGGRQLIQLFRVHYDVAQVVRITGADDKARKVLLYSGADQDPRQDQFLQVDPATNQKVPFALPDGVEGPYDLSVGEFDIEVTATPDQGSRRQEGVEAMTALFGGLPPEIAAKFLDLWFRVMDFPMALEMAERAKKLLPPELKDPEEGEPTPIPPEVQQQIAQLTQQLDAAMAALQGAKAEMRLETAKVRSQFLLQQEEYKSKERIEMLKIQAAAIKEQAAVSAEGALTILQSQIDRMAATSAQGHEAALAHLDQADRSDERDQTEATRVAEAAAAPPAGGPGAR